MDVEEWTKIDIKNDGFFVEEKVVERERWATISMLMCDSGTKCTEVSRRNLPLF
jgi:hypothetical protein